MKAKISAVFVLVSLAGVLAFPVVGATAQPVSATPSTCPAVSRVQIIPDAPGLNVRVNPGGDLPGNTLLKTIHRSDGEFESFEEKDGYLHLKPNAVLKNGGWIWNHNLSIVCGAQTPVPSPTLTATAAPTATLQPTAKPSPTRLPTLVPGEVFLQVNGTLIPCPKPCSVFFAVP